MTKGLNRHCVRLLVKKILHLRTLALNDVSIRLDYEPLSPLRLRDLHMVYFLNV